MFPTDEDPYALYKFFSLHVDLNTEEVQTNRQTYSLLDWLGDCGGLFDALTLTGKLFVSPLASFRLQKVLVKALVSKHDRKKHRRHSSQDPKDSQFQWIGTNREHSPKPVKPSNREEAKQMTKTILNSKSEIDAGSYQKFLWDKYS